MLLLVDDPAVDDGVVLVRDLLPQRVGRIVRGEVGVAVWGLDAGLVLVALAGVAGRRATIAATDVSRRESPRQGCECRY
jgi:hypothetical protein